MGDRDHFRDYIGYTVYVGVYMGVKGGNTYHIGYIRVTAVGIGWNPRRVCRGGGEYLSL